MRVKLPKKSGNSNGYPTSVRGRPGSRLRGALFGLLGLAGVLLGTSAPGLVHAWNDAGHMLIAVMVHDQLTPANRERLVRVLEAHPRYEEDLLNGRPQGADVGAWSFAAAAVWPDRVRRFAHVAGETERERLVRRYDHPRWHYINLPTFLSPSDRTELAPVRVNDALSLTSDVRTDEFNIVQALAHLESTWPRQNDAQRALSLCWLLHLYGDLHQPLHATALFSVAGFPEGDRGGNDISLGQRHNLHRFWDGQLGSDRSWSVITRSAGMARRPLTAPDETEVNPAGQLAAWAAESGAVARSEAYTSAIREQLASGQKRVRLSQGYQNNARQVAQQRLAKAADRAASRLTTLAFAAHTVQMTPLSRSPARSSLE